MMTGCSNGLLDQTTTPTAFRTKRRLQEPVPSTSAGAAGTSSSSLSSMRPSKHFRSPPGVDADVDVYEPAFKIRKPKVSATTTARAHAHAHAHATSKLSAIGPPSSKDGPGPGPAFKVKVKAAAQPKKKIAKFTCGESPIVTSGVKDKTKKAEGLVEKTINLCSDTSSVS